MIVPPPPACGSTMTSWLTGQLRSLPTSLFFRNSENSVISTIFLCRYYTTRIGVGTPPQEFSLIVDTGSTVTYVPCRNCEKCGKHQVIRWFYCAQFPLSLGTVFFLLSCNIDLARWELYAVRVMFGTVCWLFPSRVFTNVSYKCSIQLDVAVG